MTDPEWNQQNSITAEEVVVLLRRVISGELKIVAVGASWDDIYAGNVRVRIDGYKLVIFNDCNQLDYVDSITAADGRHGDSDHWFLSNTEPVDLMTDEEGTELERLLMEAPDVAED